MGAVRGHSSLAPEGAAADPRSLQALTLLLDVQMPHEDKAQAFGTLENVLVPREEPFHHGVATGRVWGLRWCFSVNSLL